MISDDGLFRRANSPEQVISKLQVVTCHMAITQCYLPPDTSEDRYPTLTPARYTVLAKYQIILLGEQRHIGVSNLPRVVP